MDQRSIEKATAQTPDHLDRRARRHEDVVQSIAIEICGGDRDRLSSQRLLYGIGKASVAEVEHNADLTRTSVRDRDVLQTIAVEVAGRELERVGSDLRRRWSWQAKRARKA